MECVFIIADMVFDDPAEDVWDIAGNFHAENLTKDFLTKLEGEGEGVGAMRTLHLLPEFGGGEVLERQAARDEQGRYYAYELLDPGPLPFVDYYATVQVLAVSETSSRLVWMNRYRVDAALVEDMRQQSLTLLEHIEKSLKSELGARRKRSRAASNG